MFKDRLRELRKNQGLSQSELAQKISSVQTTVAGWENGKREPDFSTLQRIAKYFDVSVDYLLGGSDEPKRYTVQDTQDDPDLGLVARAGRKMTAEQKKQLRRLAEYMFPEAFDED